MFLIDEIYSILIWTFTLSSDHCRERAYTKRSVTIKQFNLSTTYTPRPIKAFPLKSSTSSCPFCCSFAVTSGLWTSGADNNNNKLCPLALGWIRGASFFLLTGPIYLSLARRWGHIVHGVRDTGAFNEGGGNVKLRPFWLNNNHRLLCWSF